MPLAAAPDALVEDPLVEAYWSRFVTSAGPYPAPGAPHALAARRSLPPRFFALLTRGLVARVAAPECQLGPVHDWLAHTLARREALARMAVEYVNPLLARYAPFALTAQGLEVALALDARDARDERGERDDDAAPVVWLDPRYFDQGPAVVAAVVAPSLAAYLRASLDAAPAR